MRQLLPLIVGFLFSGFAWASGLPLVDDLSEDAQRSRNDRLPILLMYSASYCGYCDLVRDDFIAPLLEDPAYRDRLIVREVEVDGNQAMTGFDGARLSHAEFAQLDDVDFTPTVRLVDGQGRALAEPIIGVPLIDFYSAYLDNAIETSIQKLQQAVPTANRDSSYTR